MNDNGKEENFNRDRRSSLERVQEVCDRSRQRLVRSSGRHDQGKDQEVAWLFHILVKTLELSGEYVTLYKNLFLHAIKWYKISVAQEKPWAEQYLDDVDLSLLPDLEDSVRFGKRVDGDVAKLLSLVVKKYWEFLGELQKEPWVGKEKIEGELNQLNSIAKDTLLKNMGKPR